MEYGLERRNELYIELLVMSQSSCINEAVSWGFVVEGGEQANDSKDFNKKIKNKQLI